MTRPNPFGPPVETIDRIRISMPDSGIERPTENTTTSFSKDSQHQVNSIPVKSRVNVPVATTVAFAFVVGLVFILYAVNHSLSHGHLIMAVGFLLPSLWYGIIYLLDFSSTKKRLSWSMVWVTSLLILITGLYKLYPQEFTNVTTPF